MNGKMTLVTCQPTVELDFCAKNVFFKQKTTKPTAVWELQKQTNELNGMESVLTSELVEKA